MLFYKNVIYNKKKYLFLFIFLSKFCLIFHKGFFIFLLIINHNKRNFTQGILHDNLVTNISGLRIYVSVINFTQGILHDNLVTNISGLRIYVSVIKQQSFCIWKSNFLTRNFVIIACI